MIRFRACLAILALGLIPLAAQTAPAAPAAGTPAENQAPAAAQPGSGDQGGAGSTAVTGGQIKDASTSPYKLGDQAISLSAGAMLPLGIYGGSGSITGKTYLGADFSFSYRYFLNHQWAIGGAIAGAFNSTTAGRSLFTLPLDAELSWWKAIVPFEFFVESGAGAYMMRLDTHGIIDPFAKIGAGALWQTGSGWSVGLVTEGWYIPEIHYGDYSSLTRTGLSLNIGLIAVYHI
ncbi:MAG: hypothetical protein M0001_12695 [Treponema sp.]|nr:hypothetical protein [Treponema sp.]